jgi:serine phosphatase RsbU (regulator of sigma subunit)/anti-sigma regulatory factor (Ser/Thr protein kinase)
VTQYKVDDLEEKLFELEKKLESKREETRDLANIASVITSLLDIESVLAAAMEIGIRQVAGEVGAILQVSDDEPEVKVSWGVDAALLDSLIYKDNLDIVRYCLRHRETVYENGNEGIFPDNVSIRNFVCTPILAKEKENVIGIMVIFNKEADRDFTEKDILNLEMICKFASIAIENSVLLKESLEKQKMEQELDLARQVQATFLPDDVKINGLRIAASYIPARQVGGDYYDLIPLSDNKSFFLIGDVTNKGVPAALVMTSVYSIVRSYVTSRETIEVTSLMSQLNDILCNDIIKSHGMFITLFMAFVDLEKEHMEYCNGGHPPPFYYRTSTSEVIPLKSGGPIVGQFSGIDYISTRIEINRQDRIFCYTDGLIEAMNKGGELYGLARLKEFFRKNIGLDTKRFSHEVKKEIDRFSRDGSEDAIDDYTTLVIDIVDPSPRAGTYNFQYNSCLDSLEEMHTDINSIADRHNISENIIEPFRVAVSEAITNAIVHAHGCDSSKIIRFAVDLNNRRITASIIDEGAGRGSTKLGDFDPVGRRDDEGGRGLGLIKQLSDDVSFECLPQGGMVVKIVKYLS